MALERFIPKSPDPFIRNSQDFEVAKFGHLNTIIEYINSYVVTDSLQLAGSGPITSTARYITDSLGNASAISISTTRVGIGTTTPSAELHIDGHNGFGYSLRITTNKVGGVAYAGLISDYVTGVEQYQYGGPGWGWPNWTTTRAGGTAAAPTAVPSNYGLNEYSFWGHDGTGGGQAYSMMTRTSETWTTTGHGIYTTFNTVATGSTALVERMRFTGTGNITFNNASDTAKVAIKGTGSTSATTSFLVQNSSGTQLLNLKDDGRLTIGVNATYFGDSGNYISNYAGGVSALIVQAQGGSSKTLQLRGGAGTADIQTWETTNGASTLGVFTYDGKLGIGTNAPTNTFEIASTSASPFKVATTASYFRATFQNSGASGIFDFNASNFQFPTNSVDFGTSTALGARVGIKGSGSTSATTSLLVKNSNGNDVLKVTDDMYVTIQNNNNAECFQILGVNSDASIKFTPSGGNSNIVLKSQSSGLLLGTIANSWADVFATSGGQTLRIGTNNVAGGGVNYYASQNGAAGHHKWFFNNVQYAQLTAAQYVLDSSGTMSIDNSAILQANSTTQGFLPPRMTTAQKNAITTPAAGLVVFDTTLNKLCVYTTAWQTITSV